MGHISLLVNHKIMFLNENFGSTIKFLVIAEVTYISLYGNG